MSQKPSKLDFLERFNLFKIQIQNNVKKNKTARMGSGFSYKYLDLHELYNEINKASEKYNILICQESYVFLNETKKITFKVKDVKSDEELTYSYEHLVSKSNNSKMSFDQYQGSSNTYHVRYSLCNLLGVCADEDRDGNVF